MLDLLLDQLPEHSPRGASGGDRWLYRPDLDSTDGGMFGCPASVRLTEGMPDTGSIFAAEGTAAHWISELCRIDEVPAEEFLGHTDDEKMAHPDGGSFVCDQEMVDGVNYFIEYVNGLPAEARFFEPKVSYMQWVEDDGFGTADDVRFDETMGVCYITDLKYGKGVQVYAAWSVQLMLYALGVLETWGDDYEFDSFKLIICQPRLDHIDEWSISVRDLIDWANTVVRPGAELTREEDAPIQAGSWCRWCPLKKRCRTRTVWMITTADIELSLSNIELGLLLPLLPSIRSWCTDMEDLGLSEVQKGSQVGGWYLTEGRSIRIWKDPDKVEKSMRSNKFKVADTHTRKLISPAQFEKLAGKKHPIMLRHVNKPQGKPVMTPPWSNKPRYALDVSAELDMDMSDFKDLEVAPLEFIEKDGVFMLDESLLDDLLADDPVEDDLLADDTPEDDLLADDPLSDDLLEDDLLG